MREHWRAVRHLFLGDPEPPDTTGVRFRSGLPSDFWIGAGVPGMAPIKPTRGGRFEFASDGLTAVIVPAYDCIPGNLGANPEAHVEHLIDLIAVDLDSADKFWRRRGEAVVLGSVYLDIGI